MPPGPHIWRDTLRRLKEEVPDYAFDAWVGPLAVKIDSERIVLGCPSNFHRDRIRSQFLDRLRALYGEVCRRSASPETSHPESRHPHRIDVVNMHEFRNCAGRMVDGKVDDDGVEVESARAAATSPTPSLPSDPGSGHRESPPSTAQRPKGTEASPSKPAAEPQPVPMRTLHLASNPTTRSTSTSSSGGADAVEGSSNERARRTSDSKPRARAASPEQRELPFTFETFIVGPCNALAREAALALARTRQQSLNLLYLGGDSGMGKTHLARATAHEAQRLIASAASGSSRSATALSHGSFPNDPTTSRGHSSGESPRVVYTSAERFTSDFVSAVRNGRGEAFSQRYRGAIELLVVEDIQFFSGRVQTQLELFHTLQHVLDAGGRVLLTGDRAPRELTGLHERVRTQVDRGFVAELEPPDAMIRRHILRSKSAAGGVRLPENCLDLLVESSRGSVRDIEGMLIQVVTTASLLGRPIDLALTRDAIALKASKSPVLRPRTVEVSEIVRIVAASCGQRPETLASKSRRKDVLVPRQIAMYLAHRYTSASFAEIGRSLGRGHPSVRNAIDRIERQVLENAPIRYRVEALSERIDHALKARATQDSSDANHD